MDTLPSILQDKIYNYEHQLKYKDVMDELVSGVNHLIIQFKLKRNRKHSKLLNLKHCRNIFYTDDKIRCCFSFPLYSCPVDIDLNNEHTITTMNGKYCAFFNDIQMGMPFWYRIEKYLRRLNINCLD